MAQNWNKISIIGVGLIGGSIGAALLNRRLASAVIGIGRRPENLRKAKSLGAVTATSQSIDEGVADADLVIVCTPVGEIAKHVLQAAAAAPECAILTDAGSTKESIVKTVDAQLGRKNRFVGSHPLAGSEKTGVCKCAGRFVRRACRRRYSFAQNQSRPSDGRGRFLVRPRRHRAPHVAGRT